MPRAGHNGIGLRLWSLHPQYLDARGLTALWREGLLAQAALRGETAGYRRHPQLIRFRMHPSPVACIAAYLQAVHDESAARGYRFDAAKIAAERSRGRLDVQRGQLEFEWRHLMSKLKTRDPERHAAQSAAAAIRPHPLFRIVPGGVADWERGRA